MLWIFTIYGILYKKNGCLIIYIHLRKKIIIFKIRWHVGLIQLEIGSHLIQFN